jgi:hypothetical protein
VDYSVLVRSTDTYPINCSRTLLDGNIHNDEVVRSWATDKSHHNPPRISTGQRLSRIRRGWPLRKGNYRPVPDSMGHMTMVCYVPHPKAALHIIRRCNHKSLQMSALMIRICRHGTRTAGRWVMFVLFSSNDSEFPPPLQSIHEQGKLPWTISLGP